MFEITDAAKEQLDALMEKKSIQSSALRVSIRGRGPHGFLYEMGFMDPSDREESDQVYVTSDIKVIIDSDSVPNITGSTLDYVEDSYQKGFKIDNPNPLWKDPLAAKVQAVIDEQVNPALGMHGGYVSLLEVKDSTAYLSMGGGCQGCGRANLTLTTGVETMILEAVPEIEKIVDATDHAAGENPYYQKAEGNQP